MNEELYFKDAFTEVDGNINLDINNLNVNCITSKNNKFSLDSEGNLVVNSITSNISNDSNIDFNLIYPIGSIYFSTNNINPSTLFGGTWERFANGRVLVGVDESQVEFNTVRKEGGSKYSEKHHHDIRFSSPNNAGITISNTGTGESVLNISNWNWENNTKNAKKSGSNLFTNEEGSGNCGNLQPYITCYIWTKIS